MLEQLEQLRRLRAEKPADARFASTLHALRAWQHARLTATYADLAADPRYAPAVAFFLDELYDGEASERRDRDLLRMHNTMQRVLPDFAYQTVAKALSLDVMSEEFDQAMARQLMGSDITASRYAAAFRAVGRKEDRLRQVALMREVGEALDVVVKKPLIGSTLIMLRGPSKLAGLSAMQKFLEVGFNAFRHMKGARYFLDTIATRESEMIGRIFAGEDG